MNQITLSLFYAPLFVIDLCTKWYSTVMTYCICDNMYKIYAFQIKETYINFINPTTPKSWNITRGYVNFPSWLITVILFVRTPLTRINIHVWSNILINLLHQPYFMTSWPIKGMQRITFLKGALMLILKIVLVAFHNLRMWILFLR